MAEVAERIGPEGRIGMPKRRDQFVLFGDREVLKFPDSAHDGGTYRAGVDWMHAGENRWLLIDEGDVPTCWQLIEKQPLRPMYQYRWVLIRRVIVPPGCASVPP